MDDNRLLIGGLIIIALVIAIPVLGPMLRGSGYDPVADSHKLDTLNKAVATYARAHNQYPPSLHHMVPQFLAEVPLNSTNTQFQYDPRTGTVINPAAVAAEAAEGKTAGGGQGRGGGGISPATDAMTGLSVSEELKF
jgi:hypothetical protein